MDELQSDHILEVGLGFWASKTPLSAVDMEVFTELAKHPEDLETLQGWLGRFLRYSRSPEIPRTPRWLVLQHSQQGVTSHSMEYGNAHQSIAHSCPRSSAYERRR